MFNQNIRLFRDPITAGTAALITAGANLAGTGATAYAQGRMNRKTRLWNEKMYQRQRTDALADWNMQNVYNSPQAQIQRLRDAGLNPALMYKSGPDNTASTLKTPDAPSWSPQAPKFDLGSVANNALSVYQDMTMKQQQIDNLKEVQKNLATDRLLKEVKIKETNQSILDKIWNQEKSRGFFSDQLASLKIRNKQMIQSITQSEAQTNFTNRQTKMLDVQQGKIEQEVKNMVDENTRKWLAIYPNINYVIQKTKESVQDTANKEYKNKYMNQFELEKLKAQIKILDQNLKNLMSSKEGRDLLNDLQKAINAGEDPRMIGNVISGLLNKIPGVSFFKK